jgi:hypothetical protein
MTILLASILFYVMVMFAVQKRRQQEKARALALAKIRQQRHNQIMRQQDRF